MLQIQKLLYPLCCYLRVRVLILLIVSHILRPFTVHSLFFHLDKLSQHDTRETHKSEDMEPPFMKDEEPEKLQFSLFPMEEQDIESKAGDLTSQGHRLPSAIFYN